MLDRVEEEFQVRPDIVLADAGCCSEKALYAKRKWMTEASIEWIKETMGFRRFSFRSLEKAHQEALLVSLALNIRRTNPFLDTD